MQSSKLTPVGVTFFHRARDSVAAKHTVVGGWLFNDKGRGAQSVTQGAITHCHSCALGNGMGHCEPLIIGLDMLHCPKAGGGEGKDSFLESRWSCNRLLRDGGANVLHSGNGSGHTHRCTRTIARRGFNRRASVGETAVLVAAGQGSPGVPFIWLMVLPKSVGGRVVPPDPVGIKRSKPVPKGETS